MDPRVVRVLDDEQVVAAIERDDALAVLRPTRLIVADRQRLRLDPLLEQLHRVQLTVESDRPGLVTLVPTTDRYPADLAVVPRGRCEDTGQVVMAIGRVVAGTR